MILGGGASNLRVRTGAEAAGGLASDVELGVGVGEQQRLRVGVDGDELDALQPLLDHSVNSVDAAPADTDDADHGEVVGGRSHSVDLAFQNSGVQLRPIMFESEPIFVFQPGVSQPSTCTLGL